MIRSAVLTQYTRVMDRRTDGIGMAYTRYSIYAVARKKLNVILTVIIKTAQNSFIQITELVECHCKLLAVCQKHYLDGAEDTLLESY